MSSEGLQIRGRQLPVVKPETKQDPQLIVV